MAWVAMVMMAVPIIMPASQDRLGGRAAEYCLIYDVARLFLYICDIVIYRDIASSPVNVPVNFRKP